MGTTHANTTQPEDIQPGRLFYIMGPSGSGKDTLLLGAQERLAHRADFRFARRIITRRRDYGGEDHVAVTVDDFEKLLAAGHMALHWEAHGFKYGINTDIDTWLERGYTVVVSGSRHAFDDAIERYPTCMGLIVTASDEILDHRLETRRREDGDSLEQRRSRRHGPDLPEDKTITVVNDGSIPEGIDKIVAVLCGSLTWA